LEKLWMLCFRALDDVKVCDRSVHLPVHSIPSPYHNTHSPTNTTNQHEQNAQESVVLAGVDLAKSLGSLSARFTARTEGAPAAQVHAVVGVLLPLFLEKGLVSACKEVQGVSVLSLVRVVKGSGDAVRPYLPELVAALVEAQSAIEPAQLQYLQVRLCVACVRASGDLGRGGVPVWVLSGTPHLSVRSTNTHTHYTHTQFHAASMDMTEEAMEQLRYGLSRSGPLQEALDHALKELDGCVVCG
jgi:hypothetical protein